MEQETSQCCMAHSGQAKARYPSLAIARKVLKQAEKRRGVKLELYECLAHPGQWHLRKAKS